LDALQAEVEKLRIQVDLHQRTARKYKKILANMDQGYFEFDLQGRLIVYNDSMRQLLGYASEEFKGIHFSRFMTPESASALKEALDRLMETGSSEKGIFCAMVPKDGNNRQVMVSISQMRSPDGHPVGFWGTAHDETERLILESQLAQAQKLESIGQLAAGIAHEINTPTQYVGDNIHFLQDGFRDILRLLQEFRNLIQAAKSGQAVSETAQSAESVLEEVDLEYLEQEIPTAITQSLEGVERVARIVRAMKEFSHPGQDEKSPTDLNRAIQSTVTVARNEWKYVSELITDLDADLPPVLCLPGEFNQVILNMVINSVHAIADVVGDGSQGKGCITIRTRHKTPWPELQISETGGGIPDPVKSRTFDPFFTTKAMGKGTGQGLAISHSVITKKHGGTIEVDSTPGKGTTFTIRLPLNAEAD